MGVTILPLPKKRGRPAKGAPTKPQAGEGADLPIDPLHLVPTRHPDVVHWTAYDDARLRVLYGFLPLPELATTFGVTQAAVRQRVSVLDWTLPQAKALRVEYRTSAVLPDMLAYMRQVELAEVRQQVLAKLDTAQSMLDFLRTAMKLAGDQETPLIRELLMGLGDHTRKLAIHRRSLED